MPPTCAYGADGRHFHVAARTSGARRARSCAMLLDRCTARRPRSEPGILSVWAQADRVMRMVPPKPLPMSGSPRPMSGRGCSPCGRSGWTTGTVRWVSKSPANGSARTRRSTELGGYWRTARHGCTAVRPRCAARTCAINGNRTLSSKRWLNPKRDKPVKGLSRGRSWRAGPAGCRRGSQRWRSRWALPKTHWRLSTSGSLRNSHSRRRSTGVAPSGPAGPRPVCATLSRPMTTTAVDRVGRWVSEAGFAGRSVSAGRRGLRPGRGAHPGVR